ncbi:MAG: DUF445 domain-containing protein [Proteobacteria bacterium]|nr:DUF445 domain-containing protein [Pseudomonadota bacterium]
MIGSAQLYQYVCNKSLITNVVAAILIALSYCLINTPYQPILANIGFYALSCAFTNWIAIMMLFDKIPFVYGSGVIPARFESVKAGIKNLVMSEFFTESHIQAVIPDSPLNSEKLKEIANFIDYDKLYNALIEGIFESKIGSVFFMMGGQNAIEPLREVVQKKLKTAVENLLTDENLPSMLAKEALSTEKLIAKVEKIIDGRLAELTPDMVKEIIQKMIRQHLGWLVVWGGIFGGLIGLIASFL